MVNGVVVDERVAGSCSRLCLGFRIVELMMMMRWWHLANVYYWKIWYYGSGAYYGDMHVSTCGAEYNYQMMKNSKC